MAVGSRCAFVIPFVSWWTIAGEAQVRLNAGQVQSVCVSGVEIAAIPLGLFSE
jgi:hypothetical protein